MAPPREKYGAGQRREKEQRAKGKVRPTVRLTRLDEASEGARGGGTDKKGVVRG